MTKTIANIVEDALIASLQVIFNNNGEVKLPQSSNSLAIALSGGLDSVVLLHAIHQYIKHHNITQLNIYAFHINHGISKNADQWQQFCAEQAAHLNISFIAQRVYLQDVANRGVEEAARCARYQALNELCVKYRIGALLTAHHQDDQAETVLLQLMRGAGLAGLAAMSGINYLGKNKLPLLRPFLSLSRQQLVSYAQYFQLMHIEDESNQNQYYARNALRHEVMPRLAKIRQGYREGLCRSAALFAEANELLEDVAKNDLMAACELTNLSAQYLQSQSYYPLACEKLRQLSYPRARNLLRYWLRCQGLRAPSFVRLAEMLKQFMSVNLDTRASILHDGKKLSIWRQHIWLEPSTVVLSPPEQYWQWQGEEKVDLPQWGGTLQFLTGCRGVAKEKLLAQRIRITARHGGERFRFDMQRHSCSLQHAYQQNNIPPWLRNGPLLYLDHQLIWVAHLGWHINHQQDICKDGVQIIWQAQSS